MDFKQFQIESKRTQPFGAECTNNQEIYNFLGNYALGFLGEFFELKNELSKVDIKEVVPMDIVQKVEGEMADVIHYGVGLLSVLQVQFDESKLTKVENENEIYEHLANIGEIPKKHIFHGHKFDQETFVNSIYKVISFLQTNFGMNIDRILQKNIDKLKKRYPEKFNTADSIARVDV